MLVLAVAAPRAGAAAEPTAAEVAVTAIRTDQYPRVTARFTIEPAVGVPPPHLTLADVVLLEGATRAEPLEAYVVGREPTARVGTYEAVWISTAPVAAGESVVGKLVVARHNRGDLEAEYRYTRPLPRLAEGGSSAARQEMALPIVPRAIAQPPDVVYLGSVAGTLAGIAALAGMTAHLWRSRVRDKQERLEIWVGQSGPARAKANARAKARGSRGAPLSPLMLQLGKLGAKLVSTSQSSKLKRSLVHAGKGSPQEYQRFVATKAGLGLVCLIPGLWLLLGRAPVGTALLLSLCLGAVGFILPGIWLGRKIKSRQYKMRKALPDALDLMTIGVSAGLAFDGAISEIVNKWDNELSHEFAIMLGELRMGAGRRDALLNLADRTQVDEIQTMVGQLIQSEELGMSLSDTLVTLADQMRLRRRQHAEELAQKAAVKMLIPLVFLIFPALFIVILGPSISDMYKFMTQGPA